MINWSLFPLLRFAIFFHAGILLADFDVSLMFLAICGLAIIAFNLVVRRTMFYFANVALIRSIPLLLAILSLGFFSYELKCLSVQKLDTACPVSARVVVEKLGASSTNHYSAIVLVDDSSSNFNNKKLLAQIRKSQANESEIKEGACLEIEGKAVPVQFGQNPYQFDYREHLFYQGVGAMVWCKHVTVITKTSYSLLYIRNKCREFLLHRLSQVLSGSNFEIAAALILGAKHELSPMTKHVFSIAGVMHVLAVSGLHVGIIYFIGIGFLGLFRVFRKNSLFSVIISLLLVWSFAVLTGLSISSYRAAITITVFGIGTVMGERKLTLNATGLAAILISCLDPFSIFRLGFQLSFLALLGILIINPILSSLYKPRFRLSKWVWNLLTMSFSAQIITCPILVYNFHTFPTYFFLGNLIAIPLAFLILSAGIGFLTFGQIPGLEDVLGWVLRMLIQFLHLGLDTINEIPYCEIKSLFISKYAVIALYLLLGAILLYRKLLSNGANTRLATVGIILSIGLWNFPNMVSPPIYLRVYNNRKHSTIAFCNGRKAVVFTECDTDPEHLQQEFVEEGITNKRKRKLKFGTQYRFGSGKYSLVALDGNCTQPSEICDSSVKVVLLADNCPINIEQLNRSWPQAQIVADGTNNWKQMKKWEYKADKLSIPFSQTSVDGAFTYFFHQKE